MADDPYKVQGFIIAASEGRGRDWAKYSYLNKFLGKTKVIECNPFFLEIFKYIRGLGAKCDRITLLTKMFPISHERTEMVQQIRESFPCINIEVISVPYL
jgi:hypothetical protein